MIAYQTIVELGCIPKGVSCELPDFSVITGKNGSGKSHLFTSLSQNSILKVQLDGKPIIVDNIRYITFGQLIPNTGGAYNPQTLQGMISQIWTNIEQTKNKLNLNSNYSNSTHQQKINTLYNQLNQSSQ